MPDWFAEPPGMWLKPVELDMVEIKEQKSAGDTAIVSTIRNRVNKVQLGVPQTIDVLSNWPTSGAVDNEISAASARFAFYCVRLACSFIPDRGCEFRHARVRVMLANSGSGGAAVDSPVAIDLFPRNVDIKRSYSRSYGLKGGLKLHFGEASVDTSRKEEIIHYEPAVSGAGLLTSVPNWVFSSTSAQDISGIKELFLLIKKPKGGELTAELSVDAEIQTAWGLVRYSRNNLLEAAYRLAP